jgi:hypothetical protein
VLQQVFQPAGITVFLNAPLTVYPENLSGFFLEDGRKNYEGHCNWGRKAEVQMGVISIATPTKSHYNRSKLFSSCPFTKAPEADAPDKVPCGINKNVFSYRCVTNAAALACDCVGVRPRGE